MDQSHPSERRHVRNRYFLLSDAGGLPLGLYVAFVLRFEGFDWPSDYRAAFVALLPTALILKLALFYLSGLYRRLWEFAGVAELERLVLSTFGAATIVAALGLGLLPWAGLAPVRLPLSVVAIDAALTLVVLAVPRLVVRLLAHRAIPPAAPGARRALIAGAGVAGETIAKSLRLHPDLGIRPVGFVDDDPAKHGLEMCGLPVLGGLDQLVALRERHRVDELIIATPAAPGPSIRAALGHAAAAGLVARTIPDLYEILSGRSGSPSVRQLQIEDLLRREPVRTDRERVGALIAGATVLVTGAGGSIGAELCRQVSALRPRRLLLLGHGENSIFAVANEIADLAPDVECVSLIADVRDWDRMRRAVAPFAPELVFHAAAHKHVPLMELNVAEAVSNNVLGTLNAARLAVDLACDRLVLISTDKAVRSTSVMGATKRVAELVVQEYAASHRPTFISVRFGNVLGSRGSVVPVFLRQIEAGGPVRVTHPEMRRYFMTVPESVELVLQAAVQGRSGDLFVLDMGEPVRIVDLAADLIRLSGLEVGRDVEIQFTGVRPGEKLREEPFFGAEHATPTEHAKILRARPAPLPASLLDAVRDLIDAAARGAGDDVIREQLGRLVPDYRPGDGPHHVAGLTESRRR
jgi:FlaA1/EpsC-like NDP-sugar epimerase